MESLRVFTCKIILSKKRSTFTSSFSICIISISFSCLLVLARTSNAMLNRSCESKNPCLAPYFNRKAFSYSLLSILLTELVINDFYYIDICPLYTHFGKFLSWVDVEFDKMLFMHLLRSSGDFWLLLMWYITLICIC